MTRKRGAKGNGADRSAPFFIDKAIFRLRFGLLRPAPPLAVRTLVLLRPSAITVLPTVARAAHRPVGRPSRRGRLLGRSCGGLRGLLVARCVVTLLPIARLLAVPAFIAGRVIALLSILRLPVAVPVIAVPVSACLPIARLLIATVLLSRGLIARL